MSRIYKILFDNGSGKKEMFAIKPFLGRFDDFKDEIFIRLPELKKKSLKFYYEDSDGDKITIFNTNDFAIFQEQDISKVFVEVQNQVIGSVHFGAPWPSSCAPRAVPIVPLLAASQPVPSILKNMPASTSADDIRRHLHSGVICDNCDKEICGYRYKCLECADFDLCMDCEKSNHSHHLLLRIANPNDAEICYRAKLGKRFGRHRRSESLCSKPEERHEKRGHDKKPHHKRHTIGSRPANFADVVSDILKSVVGTGDVVQGEVSGSKGTPENTTQNKPNEPNGEKANASTTATPLNTPSTQGPLFPPPFNFGRDCQSGNTQLKTHIDKLSNMAQHFAAMMDPFATYVAQSANEQMQSKNSNGTQVLCVGDILDKLTPKNVDPLLEQILALNNDTYEKVSKVISSIFEKAIEEPHLSAACAQLCQKLSKPLDYEVRKYVTCAETTRFKMLLLTTCQHEFQNFVVGERSKYRQMAGELTTDGNPKTSIEKNEEKLRRRSVGIVRFIGEIFRQNMLASRIIEWCVETLLGAPTDEKLECLCTLLALVGKKMEKRSDNPEDDTKYHRDLTPHFEKMQSIVSDKDQGKLSSHVRSMLIDVIELRKNEWVQRPEPMDGVNTDDNEKPSEPQTSKQSDVMITDCTDDEEDNSTLLNRASRESSSDGSQTDKSNRGDSPSREWAFINANDIDDSAQASASAPASASFEAGASARASTSSQDGSLAGKKTGTLPKVSKELQNEKPTDEPSLDYSELSRRLNDHIATEKSAAGPIDDNLAAARLEFTRMGEYLKATENQVQPTQSAPRATATAIAATPKATMATTTVTDGASDRKTDPRITQAVNTMTAMGFSNEGGWLNQLLEAVNGDITSAIELMTPQK